MYHFLSGFSFPGMKANNLRMKSTKTNRQTARERYKAWDIAPSRGRVTMLRTEEQTRREDKCRLAARDSHVEPSLSFVPM